MVKRKAIWLGKKIGPNKRHNIFKTKRKNIPVNMFKDKDRDGVANVFDCKPNNKKKQGLIGDMVKGVRRTFDSAHQSLSMRQTAKGYSRKKVAANYKKRLANPERTPEEREAIKYERYKGQRYKAKRKRKTKEALLHYVLPVQNLTSYGSGESKTTAGVPGRGPGRPRGSVDKKYAAYGGVFGYRKYVSEQKRLLREQLKQAKLQSPQEQQLPEELQGQDITADYPEQQYQQAPVQQQVQVPQQYQQAPVQQVQQQAQPQQREIRTPFKSSGGSPYPPVSRQKLMSGIQTVPQGYVETVDAFTGRRFIKQLPQKERWA